MDDDQKVRKRFRTTCDALPTAVAGAVQRLEEAVARTDVAVEWYARVATRAAELVAARRVALAAGYSEEWLGNCATCGGTGTEYCYEDGRAYPCDDCDGLGHRAAVPE